MCTKEPPNTLVVVNTPPGHIAGAPRDVATNSPIAEIPGAEGNPGIHHLQNPPTQISLQKSPSNGTWSSRVPISINASPQLLPCSAAFSSHRLQQADSSNTYIPPIQPIVPFHQNHHKKPQPEQHKA